MTFNRRNFIKTAALAVPALTLARGAHAKTTQDKIKPPRLNPGDTVGLITPASPLFEAHQSIISATEKMNNLGFKVKLGKNVFKKWGYLAGSDQERLDDLHSMFRDDGVKAIIAIRGGYGSQRLLPMIDYDLIRKHQKILHGYSDITSLLIAIQKATGLVTFHGPVASSTYTDYTKKYFLQTLGVADPVGQIDDIPFNDSLQTSNRTWTVNPGSAEGEIVGGNLTLIAALMGTPWEIDTKGKILFIEEVGEEPNDIDRYLTQLDNAGKLQQCAGIVFDRMESVHPKDHNPGYYNYLSVEEVIADRLQKYKMPVCLGLSLGHVANKPTMPLSIRARLDADRGRLTLLESAVS